MPQAQSFTALLKTAPIRTAVVSFQGLFDVELIVTSRDEMDAATAAARTEVLNTQTGNYDKKLDEDKFRSWLATRIAGFKNLTLKKAMTLCGHDLPQELTARAKEPLTRDQETVETLLDKVTGFQPWLLNELRTIAITAARRDEQALEN